MIVYVSVCVCVLKQIFWTYFVIFIISANSTGTDSSDSMGGMRRGMTEHTMSYSVDDEDRQSEDGSNDQTRARTVSDMSNEENATSAPAGASEHEFKTVSEVSVLSTEDAKLILAQWTGNLKDLCLLRFPSDLSTSLVIHAYKVSCVLSFSFHLFFYAAVCVCMHAWEYFFLFFV